MTANALSIHELIQTIVDSDFAVPEGIDPEGLIPDLTGLLGSPDQITRERALDVLGTWGARGRFGDETLRTLGDRMAEDLGHGLGEEGTDTVFLRSYAALVLCTPIGVDQMFTAGLVEGRGPFLDPERVGGWLTRALETLQGERDLRSFIDGKGWADAIPHRGDVLHQFARSPHTDADGQERILRAIADRLTSTTDKVFVHDDGGRLMRAAYCVLLRGELPLETLTAWIDGFGRTPDGRGWFWGDLFSLEFCDHAMVNARANVRGALHDLYFYLKHGLRRWHSEEDAKNAYYAFYDQPVRYRDELLDAVDRVLRKLHAGNYSQT